MSRRRDIFSCSQDSDFAAEHDDAYEDYTLLLDKDEDTAVSGPRSSH